MDLRRAEADKKGDFAQDLHQREGFLLRVLRYFFGQRDDAFGFYHARLLRQAAPIGYPLEFLFVFFHGASSHAF